MERCTGFPPALLPCGESPRFGAGWCQVHLGALLDQGTCPPEPCATVVVATTDTGLVAFEVDDADAHPEIEILPAPEDETLSWVSGVLRKEERWVPVLNLPVLEERLRTPEVSHA